MCFVTNAWTGEKLFILSTTFAYTIRKKVDLLENKMEIAYFMHCNSVDSRRHCRLYFKRQHDYL